MASQLQIAPWSILPKITNILRTFWPDTMGTCYILELYRLWNQVEDSKTDAFLLTPGGDVDEYGTVVLVIPQHRYSIVFDTLNTNIKQMKQLLSTCTIIEWYKRPNIGPVHERFYGMIEEIIFDLNLHRSMEDRIGFAYYIKKDDVKDITYKCPDDVYVTHLDATFAKCVNDNWPHRDEDRTVPAIRHMIKYNGGVSVRLKDTDEVAAWAIYCMYGGPGFLQTHEQFRRKGYGEVAAVEITKLVAQRNIDPQVFIIDNNEISRQLFVKLGYKKTYGVKWVTVLGK